MAIKKENDKLKRRGLWLYEYAVRRAECKRQMGKESTADLYQAAGRHFWMFLGNKDMLVCEITPTLISDFQAYLQAKGLKINTVNSYLSTLRAIYNAAFDERPFQRKLHPFRKLKLRRDMTVKKPLSDRQVRKMAAADFRNRPDLALVTDLALFSFMTYGMPFVDMVRLTKKNIRGKEIVYNRHKTGVEIRIEITTAIEQLIRKYESAESDYLFPVMFASATYRQYKAMLVAYNETLKQVGQHLGIHDNLTSYVMRYTWAAEARRLHVDIAVISQALGHTNEKTTRGYFNRLDQPDLNRANQMITNPICEILMKKGERRITYL